MRRKLPLDCKIVDIKPGKGERSHIIYAKLISETHNVVIISATLDYIYDTMKESEFVSVEEYYDRLIGK